MGRWCALVGALFLLGLAAPASADAAVIFGSDLTRVPLQPPAPECMSPGTGPCTDVAFSFHTGNLHPTTAPVSGVITSVRYRSSTAETVTLRLARLKGQQQATGAGTGPTATLEPTGQITEVPVNPGLPVQQGDYLAGDGTTGTTFNCTVGAGDPGSFHLYLPPLVDGDPFRTRTTQNACEILVQATIEPDADADRLGDETQDPDDDNDGVPDTADTARSRPIRRSRTSMATPLVTPATSPIFLNTRRGTVRLVSATDTAGNTQSGRFSSGSSRCCSRGLAAPGA
jgi:hypothetical protein